MIHIVHLIQRRLDGRPAPVALPLAALAAIVLLVGAGLLLAR